MYRGGISTGPGCRGTGLVPQPRRHTSVVLHDPFTFLGLTFLIGKMRTPHSRWLLSYFPALAIYNLNQSFPSSPPQNQNIQWTSPRPTPHVGTCTFSITLERYIMMKNSYTFNTFLISLYLMGSYSHLDFLTENTVCLMMLLAQTGGNYRCPDGFKSPLQQPWGSLGACDPTGRETTDLRHETARVTSFLCSVNTLHYSNLYVVVCF